MEIPFLKASSILDVIDYDEVSRWATAALSEPIDEDILAIALCDRQDYKCMDLALQRIFVTYNVDMMSVTSALTYYAKGICKKIVDGRLSPMDGSERISRVAIKNALSGYVELDPFIYASSEAESRPAEKGLFEKAVIEEAKRILKRN